jgi:hypothetical protein
MLTYQATTALLNSSQKILLCGLGTLNRLLQNYSVHTRKRRREIVHVVLLEVKNNNKKKNTHKRIDWIPLIRLS